ncbi:response regulator transcription factor [Mucilaginibacter rubeus]|uniref:Response regulator transcription factor n=1 Tax=Mucilaginibacter rubeus TaxID=2027860 RepID=A0AAE6JJR6_9SPHI|nr:LytTR family DNA-binding domain-containing protein [Mucilaginibacter rubeus]QEM06703.1 response regulator transcription factor [Mucilaginibacter rubeus]QTE44165.1 response regulator transcription factor [Mucilaginibacter rubeus]QTE50766.1 response regulator transcription factor [Mucilaginibacter rubeus]QTE55848.1 response regulator transcription factor [Mucilaginibacter rubeus]QTE64688.1 response regulator transcription factor [Mucilaginibacter rubeus]
MITCIAIDDEPKALEVIERYCLKTSLVDLKATFREPVKAIEFLNRERVDLIFLDINMPDISGMQLVQTLSPRPMIIFTTAYSHYAVESYDLNALDYLLKPITFERFLAAINKTVAALSSKNGVSKEDEPTVFIKSGPQTYQVKVDEILYLEKDGNYITIHLKDRNILVRENMGDIFDLVPAADFLRVHKSYVVAIKHITMIEVHQLIINGEKIPIGSTYRDLLRSRLGLK